MGREDRHEKTTQASENYTSIQRPTSIQSLNMRPKTEASIGIQETHPKIRCGQASKVWKNIPRRKQKVGSQPVTTTLDHKRN